jgi:hypothetical protein
MVIYEDSLSPVAGTVDNVYQQIGQEFDNSMYPILSSFGRPLAADTDLSWYGRIIAIMSPRVNHYRGGGILGFVTSCDFFPQDPATGCPSSNMGAFFYALVPDPNNTNPNSRISVATWQRFIRGTLIHEAKHITSVSERYVHDATRAFDDAWVEEATAQQASEMWARLVYQQGPLSDIAWTNGPQCDYAQLSATCTDPVEAILHHFQFLYLHYSNQETKSILSDPTAPIPDAVIYGSSWSFMRWVTDTYGVDEATFLRSITQVKDEAGITNIVSHSGQTWDQLLGKFSLASLADNYPGAAAPLAPALRLPSWNTRDVFQGMHDFLVTGNPPKPAFPRAFPMNIRLASFGTFPTTVARVTNLPGGGWANWELSGNQVGPQVVVLRNTTGGPPPANVGLAILRVQ